MTSQSPAGTCAPRAAGAAERVVVTDHALTVELGDGRSISAPIEWYPRLSHTTRQERDNWRPIGGGRGIHWGELDEDISLENLLAGRLVHREPDIVPAVARGAY